MLKTNSVPSEILFIEDNPGDVRLMTEAFKDNKISYNLHVAKDGEIAMQMLYQQNKPDLILLDFNPKINGLDLLIKLKETPNLAEIPIIMLTTTLMEEQIKNYRKFADSIFMKPGELDKFTEMVESIRDTWLKK